MSEVNKPILIPTTTSELSILYDQTIKEYKKLKDDEFGSNDTQYQEDLQKLIKKFFTVSVFSSKFGVISSNEEIDDVLTSNLKFLLTFYYLGHSFLLKQITFDPKSKERPPIEKIRSFRKKVCKESKNRFNSFLTQLEKMNFLSKEETEEFLNIDKPENNFPLIAQLNPYKFRTIKINRMKKKRDLSIKLKKIQEKIHIISEKIKKDKNYKGSSENEDISREYYITMLQFAVINSFEELFNLNRELHIIDHLEKNPPPKRPNFNKSPIFNKNIPQKSNINMKVIQAEDKKGLIQQCATFNKPGGPNVLKILPGSKVDFMQKIRSEVFKVRNPPTISLEEYGEQKRLEMLELEKKNKEFEKNKKEEDPEDEEVIDRKTYEAREWDDWKDNHPKGMGNMLGK